MSVYASLDAVRTALRTPPHRLGEGYAATMLHFVPDLPLVKRRPAYLAEKATGQAVLDLGAAGPISHEIQKHALAYWAISKDALPEWAPHGAVLDLDEDPWQLPVYDGVNLLIASELLEHLANPGRFLQALAVRYPDRALYLTVPQAGAYHLQGQYENVNGDHVAWYSYTTLATLLRRYSYSIEQARWYGTERVAEGLIVLTRTPTEVPPR